LETNSDPLGKVRQLLKQIWLSARLDGMLVPVYQADGTSVTPSFVEQPAWLAQADPFAPRMPINAASLALQFSQRPEARLGAVLRPCEARAFRRLVEGHRLAAHQWLVIGVDCLASFPEMDFEWRVRKARTVEVLTREALRFARQGGIAPHRYRDACQMCLEPSASQADLSIELLGLPVKQLILVSARDEDLAKELHLVELTDGAASQNYLARREALLDSLARRRRRTLERKVQTLSTDAPSELSELLRHIAGCAPCQACLEACPIYAGDFIPALNGGSEALQAAREWLEGCVACGMCEEACPKHLPLTAILSQIAHPELAVRVDVVT
jgi:formate dehydrogenase subunit beta